MLETPGFRCKHAPDGRGSHHAGRAQSPLSVVGDRQPVV